MKLNIGDIVTWSGKGTEFNFISNAEILAIQGNGHLYIIRQNNQQITVPSVCIKKISKRGGKRPNSGRKGYGIGISKHTFSCTDEEANKIKAFLQRERKILKGELENE